MKCGEKTRRKKVNTLCVFLLFIIYLTLRNDGCLQKDVDVKKTFFIITLTSKKLVFAYRAHYILHLFGRINIKN